MKEQVKLNVFYPYPAKKVWQALTDSRILSIWMMDNDFETIISFMRPDVKWANGVEGGFVYGRDAVREYWINQFKHIQAELETLKFETDENNRNVVTVHQVIKDSQGNLLADATIQQIFTIEDGLISLYEIGETETIQEMIQKGRIER